MAGLNLMDMIMSAAGGQLAQSAGSQLGLNASQSQGAIAALMPAISSALKQNASSPQGLAGLLGALQGGSHSQYVDQPEALARPETITDGNAILGHLFGSKDVSRAVASAASEKSGISSSILKKMLPLVATMAMGSLSKQSSGGTMKTALAGLAMKQLLGGNKSSSGIGSLIGALTGSTARAQTAAAQTQKQGLGILGNLLDADGDGNNMDDILGMAMRQFMK